MPNRFDDYDRVAVVTGSDSGIGEAIAVAILASPAAYVTGASYVLAGGMLLMGPQAGSHLQSDDWRNG
jgi:NAD(P)-dependent dehydrogenase (short-subunit alcohol dehydrogenase family)